MIIMIHSCILVINWYLYFIRLFTLQIINDSFNYRLKRYNAMTIRFTIIINKLFLLPKELATLLVSTYCQHSELRLGSTNNACFLRRGKNKYLLCISCNCSLFPKQFKVGIEINGMGTFSCIRDIVPQTQLRAVLGTNCDWTKTPKMKWHCSIPTFQNRSKCSPK